MLHLLYANTLARGAAEKLSPDGLVADSQQVEVIEDLLPLRDIDLALKLPENIKRVTLEPQGKEIPFGVENGRVKIAVDEFACHQMVELNVEC